MADTSQNIVTSALADRKYLAIFNNSNRQSYIGSSTVSAANGFPMAPSSSILLRAGAAVNIHFVGSSDQTPEMRTLELS